MAAGDEVRYDWVDMREGSGPFDRSVAQQIALNRARTPTQRFQAMCALLDALRAMAPKDAAQERRRRALNARRREREELREQWRRWAVAERIAAVRSLVPITAEERLGVILRRTRRRLLVSANARLRFPGSFGEYASG
jgi:hypothetical protein